MQAPAVTPALMDASDVAQRGQRWWARALVIVVVVLLLPVPWMHKSNSSVGLAWGMDNRLVLEGQRLDPPGKFSWLTVGRPLLVAELTWQRVVDLFEEDPRPVGRDLRTGSPAQRPVHAEPVAAAVGLALAGDGLPDAGEVAPVDAVIGGHGPPYSWIRSMSMGSSHGLMVGLVAYVAASGEDLAAGRHIAGTGQLLADGSVGRIGGLVAKAAGARRAGADVLLVPASQQHQLYGVDTGGMDVLPVHTLADAIEQLRSTRPMR